MEKIQMVDLVGQYRKIKEEIDAELLGTIMEGRFINGPAVRAFANDMERYLNVNHVVPCGNGTDALQIAMMAYGWTRGAEVLVPSWTYVATVEVLVLLGLQPVFVEVDPRTFNMDPEDLAKKISDKTVAVAPVHLYGQCADMERIWSIAAENHLVVIEDAAQSLGADHFTKTGTARKAGTIGHIGTTSFFPSKNLGCFGDGGAVMTNDPDLKDRMQMIANHGQRKKYFNEMVGVNSRLDTVQAAILRVKLKYMDDYAKARRTVADRYDAVFKNEDLIEIPERSEFSTHVFHQYTLKLHPSVDRDKLRTSLSERGIPSMVYYPVPNHLQKAYRHLGYKPGDLPVTESLADRVLSLPVHTEMTKETQTLVMDVFLSSLKSNISLGLKMPQQ